MNEEEYLELAQESLDAYHYDDAREYCEKALEVNPNSEKAYSVLGDVAYFDWEEEKAFEYYKKALSLNPNNFETYYNLADVSYEMNEIEKAYEYYQKSLNINSKYIHSLFGLGRVYRHKKKYDRAIEYYQKAIEIDNKFLSAYYGIDSIYGVSKEYELAVENLKRLIRNLPDNQSAYSSLAKYYQKMKEDEKALEVLNNAITRFPKSQAFYYEQAKIYESQPNPNMEKVIALYEKALENDPQYYEVYTLLSHAYTKLTPPDYETSIAYLDTFYKMMPKLSCSYNNIGTKYLNHPLPNYKKAKECFRESVALDKDKYENHYPYVNLFEFSLVHDEEFDRALEEVYLKNFVEVSDKRLVKRQYSMLKILNNINHNEPYDIEEWLHKYADSESGNWNWTAIDRWLTAKEESDIKDKLLETVAVFKRCQ